MLLAVIDFEDPCVSSGDVDTKIGAIEGIEELAKLTDINGTTD